MAAPVAFLSRPLPGYREELSRAEQDIASLEERRRTHSQDSEKRVRLVYRLFHRASLTGIMSHFDEVAVAVREAIEDFGPKEDLCLLKANLDLRFHRLSDVRRDLKMCPLLPERAEGRVLLTDVDFQEGRYEAARLELERLIAESPSWDKTARLAHWHSKLGDAREADALYQEAEDELTAKQMRSYAWIELQRGVLAITHGRYTDARKHYERSEAAYPGHWHTDEHFAELLASEGRFEDAANLFQKVIARCPKPELQQALGELYLFCGQWEKAQPWFDSALKAHLESVERGEVHYFHHLADFYADAGDEASEAVRFAQLDQQMRSNFSTQAALAWALYRNRQLPEALDQIRLALASGVQDAGIFSTASAIFTAAGETANGDRYATAARQLNPHHQNFHMHH